LRTGVFGGTFDPPHVGHLILSEEALAQLGLGRVLWVLTPDPPHKQDRRIAPLADRYAMLLAAVADNPSFEVSRVDIDRPPPHYALDTVRLLAREYPEDEIIYLMGSDSLRDLPTWHRADLFVEACHAIGVMRRAGVRLDLDSLEAAFPGLKAKVRWIDVPLIEIASSSIRERATSGDPYRYYLPPAVFEYIRQHYLYQPVK
jgi:nicotinate-nucleotide adenylyltransferase